MRKHTILVAAALLAAGAIHAQPDDITAWTEQTDILDANDATNQAGATLQGDWLYLLGGNSGAGDTDAVWRFPVNPTSLGTGVSETALPATGNFAYIFEVTASTPTTLYVAGGGWNFSAPTLWDRTHYIDINPDGSLGATWNDSAVFPNSYVQQLGGAVIADNGFLYVFGGRDDTTGGQIYDDCYYAEIQPDGSLGAWQTGTSLPVACWFLGSTTIDNHLIVHPGLTGTLNDTVTDYVWVCSVDPVTGAMGSWVQQTATLPAARYNLNLEAAGDWVYAIGGRQSGGNAVSTVWKTQFDSGTGTIGTWDTADADLPEEARYHDVAYSAETDRLYVVGSALTTPGATNKAFISSELGINPATSVSEWLFYK